MDNEGKWLMDLKEKLEIILDNEDDKLKANGIISEIVELNRKIYILGINTFIDEENLSIKEK